MKLPNCEQATVPREKLTEYLLSPDHPDGRDKAAFFSRVGFSIAAWQILAEALLRHAAVHEVARIADNEFGKRYVVEGPLDAPDGRTPLVRSVWFVAFGNELPRLVSAYPLRGSGQ